MRNALIVGLALVIAFALVVVTACGGKDEETAVTAVAVTQPAPTATGQAVSPIEKRLTAAGYHVQSSPVPPGIAGARVFLTTGVGPMIVYIIGFGSAEQAAAFGRAVAATAARTPKQVIARRVGKNVYSGVAAENPNAVAAVTPFVSAVRAAEGKRARLVRISPR